IPDEFLGVLGQLAVPLPIGFSDELDGLEVEFLQVVALENDALGSPAGFLVIVAPLDDEAVRGLAGIGGDPSVVADKHDGGVAGLGTRRPIGAGPEKDARHTV